MTRRSRENKMKGKYKQKNNKKNFSAERHESLDWRKREENTVMPDIVNEKWTTVTEW